MKECVCHFTKWQIHPFISKGTKERVGLHHSMNENISRVLVQCGANICGVGSVDIRQYTVSIIMTAIFVGMY